MYPLITMSVGGFLLSMIYMVANFIYTKIRQMLMCSVTIHSNDPLYNTALEFLTEKGFLQGSMSQMKAQLKK